MAPTIDSTLGGSTANSYVSLAEALAIANNLPFADKWLETPDDDLVVALITATRWLETLTFQGDRCTAEQRLKWPRSGAECDGVTSACASIPYDIQQAEVILAYAWVERPAEFPGQGTPGGGAQAGTFVSKNQLGDLVQEFSAFPNGQGGGDDSCLSCDNPAIINSFPWLSDLLKCWANTTVKGGRVLLRLRS